MALTDINFQEGERQELIVEITAGTLNAPADTVSNKSDPFPVSELPASSGGTTTKIFIMSE